jgi:hypothetical protein
MGVHGAFLVLVLVGVNPSLVVMGHLEVFFGRALLQPGLLRIDSHDLWRKRLQKALHKHLCSGQVFFERRLDLLGRKNEPATFHRVGA